MQCNNRKQQNLTLITTLGQDTTL